MKERNIIERNSALQCKTQHKMTQHDNNQHNIARYDVILYFSLLRVEEMRRSWMRCTNRGKGKDKKNRYYRKCRQLLAVYCCYSSSVYL